MDRHRCDVDPNPDLTFHFAADPDLDPDPDPSSTPSCTHVGKSEQYVFTSSHSSTVYIVYLSRQRLICHNFLHFEHHIEIFL